MIQMVGMGCDCDFLNYTCRPAENQPMLIPALLTVLLGAILNGGTAVMEDEDVVRHIGLVLDLPVPGWSNRRDSLGLEPLVDLVLLVDLLSLLDPGGRANS